MDRLDVRVGKELADTSVRLALLRQNRVDHHPRPVEPAERQHSGRKHRRDFIQEFGGILRAFADEDRVARPIGVRDIVADVIQQEHALADLAVGEADSAGKAWLLGDGHANDASLRELCIAESVEMPIRRGVDASDSVSHAPYLGLADEACFRQLALKQFYAVASPRTPCYGPRQPMGGVRDKLRLRPVFSWDNNSVSGAFRAWRHPAAFGPA